MAQVDSCCTERDKSETGSVQDTTSGDGDVDQDHCVYSEDERDIESPLPDASELQVRFGATEYYMTISYAC